MAIVDAAIPGVTPDAIRDGVLTLARAVVEARGRVRARQGAPFVHVNPGLWSDEGPTGGAPREELA
jgi:hypothetical protein